MTESVRAVKTWVQIGSLTVDGFMLPDGSYRTQPSTGSGMCWFTERNARELLQSKALKTLLGEGYTPVTSEIEPNAEQVRGGSRIRALPLGVVGAYWLWQAARGNKTALSLVVAPLAETLERPFDAAFDVTRTRERNKILSQRVQELEQDVPEAFAC